MDETREAIAAATRSNVSIYTVDPRGLTALGDDTIGVATFGDPGASNAEQRCQRVADGPRASASSSLMSELRLSQDSLRTLADETGGFAAVNSNELTTAFERIVRDNSGYYVLAYYPPSDKRDGKFHQDRGARNPARIDRARAPRVCLAAGESPDSQTDGQGTVARAARGAEQPHSGQRPHDARIRGAIQGDGAKRVGRLWRRAARARSFAGVGEQGRAHIPRGRCRRQDARKQDRRADDRPAPGDTRPRSSHGLPPPQPGGFAAGTVPVAPRRARLTDRQCRISGVRS